MPEENTQETGARSSQRRGRGARWERGQSGNPNGRPKGVPNRATQDIRAMAQALTLGDPKFVARLQRQLRSGTCHPSLVQTLLAYGYGKPMERTESVVFDLAAMLERIERRDAAGLKLIGPVPKHPRDSRPPLALSATGHIVDENSDSTRADESELDDDYPDEIILPVEVRHPAPPIAQRSAQAVQQQGGEARTAAGPRPAVTPWGCDPPGCARPV
jgi:hypothetical protein